jgi:hypothetical protein
MLDDMGLVASNLLPKIIVQSLRQGKKKKFTIEFQFVNINTLKTCAFGQEICDT